MHVFTECNFTQKVWSEVLKELNMNITLPTNWNNIFFISNDCYQGTLHKNIDFARAWEALPRFVCWKNWNARKKEIFEGKNVCINKVSVAKKALWVDTLSIRGMKSIKNEPLTVEERTWMVDILWNPSPRTNPSKKSGLPCWQIRMSMEELQNWRINTEISSLFFDGASKGKPGIASAGASGVIFDCKGNKQKEYACGIGRETNNGAEWYALIKGLELAKKWRLRK